MNSFAQWLDRNSLYLALPIAWVALLGSLYFSEVQHFVPCALCWYQRILMYPLAALLVIGLLRRDEGLAVYLLPFSIIGIGVASYHYLLQKTLWFGAPAACGSGPSCGGAWINWFGFVTIPFLALIAFLIITLLALVALLAPEEELEETSTTPWFSVLGPILLICGIFGWLWLQPSANSNSADTPGIDLTQPLASSDDITLVDGEGAMLYQEACASCHGQNQEGVEGLGNALDDSALVHTTNDKDLLTFIQQGRTADDPKNQSGMAMPPRGGRPDLSDEQLMEIISFLRMP